MATMRQVAPSKPLHEIEREVVLRAVQVPVPADRWAATLAWSIWKPIGQIATEETVKVSVGGTKTQALTTLVVA